MPLQSRLNAVFSVKSQSSLGLPPKVKSTLYFCSVLAEHSSSGTWVVLKTHAFYLYQLLRKYRGNHLEYVLEFQGALDTPGSVGIWSL